MRVALYARVSTTRQAQAQTIEQQLTRLRSLAQQQGWTLSEEHIYRDDGFSGASLRAYPNNPAARKAIRAQAKWRKAR
jgi:site-specific DNA recombinase